MKNLYTTEKFIISKLLTASLEFDLSRIEREMQSRTHSGNQYTFTSDKYNFDHVVELVSTLRAKLAAIDNQGATSGDYFVTDC